MDSPPRQLINCSLIPHHMLGSSWGGGSSRQNRAPPADAHALSCRSILCRGSSSFSHPASFEGGVPQTPARPQPAVGSACSFPPPFFDTSPVQLGLPRGCTHPKGSTRRGRSMAVPLPFMLYLLPAALSPAPYRGGALKAFPSEPKRCRKRWKEPAWAGKAGKRLGGGWGKP